MKKKANHNSPFTPSPVPSLVPPFLPWDHAAVVLLMEGGAKKSPATAMGTNLELWQSRAEAHDRPSPAAAASWAGGMERPARCPAKR